MANPLSLSGLRSRPVTAAAAFVVGLALLAPAAAAAADPPAAEPGARSERIYSRPVTSTVLARTEVGKTKAPQRNLTSAQRRDEAKRNAIAHGQYSYLDASRPMQYNGAPAAEALELPDRPDEQFVQTCLSAPNAQSGFGRIYNRFQWCKYSEMGTEFYVIKKNKIVKIGTTYVRYYAVAFGSDQSREVRVFYKVKRGSVVYYRWKAEYFALAPWADFTIEANCVPESQCTRHGPSVTRKYLSWDGSDDWVHWDIESHPRFNDPTVEKAMPLEFYFAFKGVQEGGFGEWGSTETHKMRCDSAPYFAGDPAACVFTEVMPHWQIALNDPTFPQVARHIYDAQNSPDSTHPPSPGRPKVIPGKFTDNRDDDGLHRIPDNSRDHVLNGQEKDRACASLPRGENQQCDEYPFASTLEGAAHPYWDYSVRMVDGKQNGDHGNALKGYYRADRILYDSDEFWVHVKVGGGGGGEPVPDSPPRVNAGPDTSGDEGSQVTLGGSVSDDNGPPDARWSYAAGSDVDPGATCQFGSPQRGRTTFACTDDGTFTVTLTADDGANAPVSDSATVTVRNVAPSVHSPVAASANGPALGIVDPDPWQLFRVGDPVELLAPFADPGANDTHTCEIDWDDGTKESVDSDGLTCSRRHTFSRAGMYTIKTTVSDDDSGSDTASVMVIVYDPMAGVGRGNGWLDIQRQTSFNFTGSYPDAQATVPQGAVTFLMQQGGPHLRAAHTLEWVVVTRDHKVAIKGTGEREPGKKVGFVLYGYDDCRAAACPATPDKFRMVIWDAATGTIPGNGPAIYDNRANASYDLDRADPQRIDSGLVHIT